MKLGFILLLLALVSCQTPTTGPATILAALDELPPGETPRLYLDANQAPRWVVPIAFESLPTAVERTSRTLLQEGHLRFVGRVYGGPIPAYLIEKLYPELGQGHLRRVIVADDGSVILRSHSLPRDQAPKPVTARIAATDELESLEFVEGEGQSYFRATTLEAGGVRRVRTYSSEGELLWETRVLSVETSVAR